MNAISVPEIGQVWRRTDPSGTVEDFEIVGFQPNPVKALEKYARGLTRGGKQVKVAVALLKKGGRYSYLGEAPKREDRAIVVPEGVRIHPESKLGIKAHCTLVEVCRATAEGLTYRKVDANDLSRLMHLGGKGLVARHHAGWRATPDGFRRLNLDPKDGLPTMARTTRARTEKR